jgi:hypothetical protein
LSRQRNWEVAVKTVHNVIVVAVVLWSSSAVAQYTDGVIKIGVLTDMSSLYVTIPA